MAQENIKITAREALALAGNSIWNTKFPGTASYWLMRIGKKLNSISIAAEKERLRIIVNMSVKDEKGNPVPNGKGNFTFAEDKEAEAATIINEMIDRVVTLDYWKQTVIVNDDFAISPHDMDTAAPVIDFIGPELPKTDSPKEEPPAV